MLSEKFDMAKTKIKFTGYNNCKLSRHTENLTSNELYIDIMIIIFLKVSLKTLIRCRCVSKLWRKTINSSYFADQYQTSNPAKESQLAFLLDNSTLYALNPNISSNFFTRSQHPIARFGFSSFCCYLGSGLFLSVVNVSAGDILCLFNPIRGEEINLPMLLQPTVRFKGKITRADFSLHSYGLGFSSLSKQFKLVCLRVSGRVSVAEIYISGSNKWRRIRTIPDCRHARMRNSAVSTNGSLHWNTWSKFILTFDLEKEEFKVIDLPKSQVPGSGFLFKWREELAILGISRDNHKDLWVVADYENTRWGKLGEINCAGRQKFLIGTWEKGIVIASADNREIGYYDLKECKVTTMVDSSATLRGSDLVCSYTCNFVSLANYMIK